MKLRFDKCVPSGNVLVPPSKSYIHRYLTVAGFFYNPTAIYNLMLCDDTAATVDCLTESGISVENCGEFTLVKRNGRKVKKSPVFNCRQSASTLRFMLPASLVWGHGGCFTGEKRLLERISDDELNIFRENGITVLRTERMIFADGRLQSGQYTVDGSISSQWISGLLMSLPFCSGDSIITVKNGLASKPYVDLTIDVLHSFGICVMNADYQRFFIKGGCCTESDCSDIRKVTVEGDLSAAAALLSLELAGGKINLNGINQSSLQGDKVFSEYFEIMKNGFLDVNVSDTPDLVPTLMSCGALLNGCALSGVSRLRHKESDRVRVMVRELSKFGVKCSLSDDKATIYRTELKTPAEPLICCKDHRIAMSLAPLLCITGGELSGCECVSKSYPEFFDAIKNLGVSFTEVIGEEK